MRLLLINSNRYYQPWPIIPFGLCWIASAVEAAGHEVRVLDLCFSSRPEGEIESVVKAVQPHLIGISIRNIDNGTGYQTLYAHLSGVAAGCGQSVSQGQTIGYGGNTGNSTGAHLHFEVRYQGGFVSPWFVLPPP